MVRIDRRFETLNSRALTIRKKERKQRDGETVDGGVTEEFKFFFFWCSYDFN